MRGHGRSRAGSEGVTLEAAARDLQLLLETLDLRDAIVVGHSMGGMVLGRFSIQHIDVLAERVAGRVFLATSAAAVSIRGLSGGLIGLTKAVVGISRASLRNPRLQYPWNESDLSAAMVRGAFGRHPTARMVEDVRTMLAEVTPSTLAEAGASIASHDVTAELGAVDGPTLVIVGERDLLTPPPHARAIARLIEGARIEEIPSVGHQVMQEAPDVLVDALDRFGAELPTLPAESGLSEVVR
jgi:pimeloyl-ACP methyl ester carboxylesterase